MNKLVIFGVGLIGGSLALALKRNSPELRIVGMGRNGENLQTAVDLGVVDEMNLPIEAALQDADMVVIAAPVAQTPNILKLVTPHLGANTIITDVGSTKSDVIQYATAALGDRIRNFVPGHPIAGAEKSGVTAARADLFDGKNVVLTPSEETDVQACDKVRKMWSDAGAIVCEMPADHHDQIFAAVSHLPHLLAFALVDDLASRTNAEELFSFAAGGFRDFSRIAGSSAEMWRDISLANREALLKEIDAYQASLLKLRELLDQKDASGLHELFENASQKRNAWGAIPANKPRQS